MLIYVLLSQTMSNNNNRELDKKIEDCQRLLFLFFSNKRVFLKFMFYSIFRYDGSLGWRETSDCGAVKNRQPTNYNWCQFYHSCSYSLTPFSPVHPIDRMQTFHSGDRDTEIRLVLGMPQWWKLPVPTCTTTWICPQVPKESSRRGS